MRPPAYHLAMPVHYGSGVVFASPHSGRDYSDSFLEQSVLDRNLIRSSEDAFVDQLFACAPDHGCAFLHASAPRAFVDLNRNNTELDSAVITGVTKSVYTPRVLSGLGVIPRVVSNSRAIYRGKLTLDEATTRLDQYWRPYHPFAIAVVCGTSKLWAGDLDRLPFDASRSFGWDVSRRSKTAGNYHW